jgi:hypothetical protein
MAVPIAVGAGTCMTAMRNGVISEAPTPVRPTRKPTKRPKRAGTSSKLTFG